MGAPKGDERPARYLAGFQPGRQFVGIRRLHPQEHHDLHDWNRSVSGLRRDEMLPTAPRFSPDGSKVAYVRLGAVSRMVVFSISDGKEWPMGGTHWQCPPVWSSANRGLDVRRICRRLRLGGKEIETGLRTGRRVQVANDQSAVNDELDCWPKGVDVTSPFFRKLRVETEETSSILRLPSTRAGRLSRTQQWLPGGMQSPCGAGGATWICWRLRLGDAHPDERRRSNKHSRERNPLEHGFPLWFRGLRFRNRRAASGDAGRNRGSNQRTMGETPDFNGLRR